jgi:peptide/nickel transport system substrate-binding protein
MADTLQASVSSFRRRPWSGAAALFFSLGLFTVPAHAETELHARLNADILTTEPGDRRDENTDAILMHVVEGLVASRDDGEVAPMLARDWTVSPDGTAYTFHLRTDVTFHNGAPLTSAEVLWTLQRYFRQGSRWRCKLDFSDQGIGKMVSLTAPDAHTVTITLDRPAPLLLKTMSRTDCTGTGIFHPDSVAPDGTWRTPIGTGPYTMGEWRRNQYVELIKFDRYAALTGPVDGYVGDKTALVDRARLLVIPDGSAAVAALLRGSLDVLDNLSPTELGSVRGKPGIRLDIAPTMDFYGILFQTNDSVLGDTRLRQAIALTIDTVGLTKTITWDTSKPNNSPVPVISPYFGPVQAAGRKPDIAEARRLVKETGYDGRPIKLITNRRYPQMFDAAVLVQAMARQAGINIEIETLDWASQLARYGSGNYQMMTQGFSARLDPSLLFNVLIGDKTRDPRKTWGTEDARRMLQRSMETGDPAARQAAFDALDKAFMDYTPAIIFYNTSRIAAVQGNVTGYRGWAGAQQRLWGVAVNAGAGD